MTGKRKRDTSVVSRTATTDSPSPPPADNGQDIFRKYFEAQFEPLDLPASRTAQVAESDDENDEDKDEASATGSDWDGLSEENDENPVEVVEHKEARSKPGDRMDKKARKAFMLPSLDAPTTKPTTTPKEDEEDDAADAENLKHDLSLQRLLRESHLLDSASELAPTGKNRLKAMDLRMQSLGAKSSLYDQQQKMPSLHRRGIKAKAVSKDDKRRREAKENGIVLEKPAPKASKTNSGRRERGVGGSSLGKFSGGTLNLSKRDLLSVQSMGGRSGRGRGRGRGRR
ncbi:hypothetical protein NUU61_002366 [Penicillium alfredii]|uniref:Protein FAF1 n=1 Tax=Penicillium alfredii TaxID=1506179 RepID=A0A9W9FRK4_9EURO|nr:uncharacterized protein NUU61_002366 [Penicillium alfredii]KAJ5105019.1 hypothetical protein NUU61_002366 [Penicillium alfredii]